MRGFEITSAAQACPPFPRHRSLGLARLVYVALEQIFSGRINANADFSGDQSSTYPSCAHGLCALDTALLTMPHFRVVRVVGHIISPSCKG